MTFDGKSPMADLRRANGKDEPWRVKYFGVGNENWGCGGNMTAEFYADQYKRYATYVRNFGENTIYKIAGGASVDDYHWTEVLMREAGKQMDGLSIHYYTRISKDWSEQGSATEFDENHWFSVMQNALFTEELVVRHSKIMDKYDPEKKVGLIVDEWGTWFAVEPGTNPGFLYQQNTMRDALVAGIHLNIFNNHCDRVQMANIAQMVNVLQAVILTEGKKMLLTPTYHVFDMYKVHQDAEPLSLDFESPEYTFNGEKLPQLNASASIDSEGKIHVTICNLNPSDDAEIDLDIRGITVKGTKGEIITSNVMNAKNTFEEANNVTIKKFEGIRLENNHISGIIPSKAVVMIEIV